MHLQGVLYRDKGSYVHCSVQGRKIQKMKQAKTAFTEVWLLKIIIHTSKPY